MRYRLRLATWTVVREPGQPSPRTLSDPEAAALLALDLARVDQRRRLRADRDLGVHQVVVHPREVLGPALREGASSLILIHSHPSGDPTPSREDLRLTRQLVEAAQLLDLRIQDHIIVGNGTDRWVSFAQRGQL